MTQILCDAIQNHLVLSFYYKQSLRTVEPHLIGYDSNNNLTLSAWQLSGGSGQGFRDFHVSNISGVTTTGKNFVGARPGYNRNDATIPRVLHRL